jgi:methionine synthase II (cobalamin-independent)
MFATLLGGLPRPPLGADAPLGALVEAAVRAQEAAGLDPITDGGFGADERPLDAWLATARLTDRAVKQAVLGPFSYGWSLVDPVGDRKVATLARADALNAELRALAAAGCPLIEVHEPAATVIGADEGRRALFGDAHRRLLDGLGDTHVSLAITGGNADTAGIETILAAPYASLAVDLIAGPDNWHLVTATPGDRGIVCGALSPAADAADEPEVLLWALAYAASTGGRGRSRVGLATASSLDGLSWEAALRKLGTLGDAARLADLPPDEAAQELDPRAIDIRSAALGRVEPPRPRRPDPGPKAT